MSERCTPDCGGQHPETTETDKRQMMRQLYDLGWGYHALADLTGRSHADVRDLLIRGLLTA